MELKDYMNKLFYPKSIAIIEASEKIPWYIRGIIERGFEGELYLVSKEKKLFGIECYNDISELPDNIDFTIIVINKRRLLDIIKKCIQKNFQTLHIFSAGLGEYDDYGAEIEQKLHDLLKNSNTRAIGPNCMGIYSTGGKISYSPYFSTKICEKSCVSFVSHSGDLTTRYVIKENEYGVNFSTVASIGNSVDLNFTDFINYFNENEKTEIIAGYFEGFSKYYKSEGRYLLKILKNLKKPALILRGGVSEQGKRAVSSHTGTIASDSKIWDSIFKQTPAIKINTYEELIDSTIAFYYCKNICPTVKSILLITWSGGKAVLGVDRIVKLGIDVPKIQEPTRSKLQSMISIGSILNPLDLPWIGRKEKFFEICKIAIDEPYIGGIIFETFAPLEFDKGYEIYYNNIIRIFKYANSVKKPFLISLPYFNVIQREKLKNKFVKDSVPIFPSIERAAKAFLNLYNYQKKQSFYSKS
ncbi:MAG: CoA-binding protein [Candidatus Helarchaeota archaeon]